MLKLLEDHHRQLGHIIKSRAAQPVVSITVAEESALPLSTSAAVSSTVRAPSPSRITHSPPSPTLARRKPRELSSSIVSSLATARGKPPLQQRRIPAAPELSVHNAGGRILAQTSKLARSARQQAPEAGPSTARRQSLASEDPRAQPTPGDDTAAPLISRTSTDEPFQRFFSTFENFLSALSAPLAFAGLPLSGDTSSQAPNDTKPTAITGNAPAKHTASNLAASVRARASSDPDISALFSKAALRAVRESTAGPSFGQESFYVVPTSGGTVSYAGIMRSDEGDLADSTNAKAQPDTIEEEADEFVDARETPGQPSSPPSPRSRHRSRKDSTVSVPRFGTRKTREELEMENRSLKELLDAQSKRLHMWETTAQSQSMALAQSIRATGASVLLAPHVAGGPMAIAAGEEAGMAKVEKGDAGAAHDARIRELEELLRAERRDRAALERANEKMGRENEKLLGYLGRYREKWEDLKAGARSRREKGTSTKAAGEKAGQMESREGEP